MQGNVFVDKKLFTQYVFNGLSNDRLLPNPEGLGNDYPADDDGDSEKGVSFGISLSALLECLQIFGAETATRERWNQPALSSTMATRPAALGTEQERKSGKCTMIYQGEGYPLQVILEEDNLSTSCTLTTYEPDDVEEFLLDQPLTKKIIMKADWLYDAIQELDGSSPDRLIISASPCHPFFSLSSTGPMGSTSVEFSNERSLLETFQVPTPVQNIYKFHLIKHAARAMAIATKVSIRGDSRGILSLQFMITMNKVMSFVDFRYLPFQGDSDNED
ncbi:uncharacterized protein H6S33_003588 [Morchella sextelata]|uniref:uncharacterized protein n=1 Tax=Morchella sextelata TaxID=1174677 RepID=UPI001D050824|nr:uncharacterized protein H6S33_003588 [Morchella sextelata]KAH0606754.1 hypothetical protein H6S33_003588 [Morchella sextelata]